MRKDGLKPEFRRSSTALERAWVPRAKASILLKLVAVAKVIEIITIADILAVGSEDERRVRADDMSERQGGLRIRRNLGELIEQEKRSIPGLCEQIATISFWQQSPKYW
jgi:hypothetical protein